MRGKCLCPLISNASWNIVPNSPLMAPKQRHIKGSFNFKTAEFQVSLSPLGFKKKQKQKNKFSNRSSISGAKTSGLGVYILQSIRNIVYNFTEGKTFHQGQTFIMQ